MKNRIFSTEKLAESVKELIKAADLKNEEVYTDTHISPAYYYKALNSKQTI